MPEPKTNLHFQKSLAYLATLGPLGYLRPAPGTIGSLFAVITGYGIASFGADILALTTFIVTILGIGAADAYARLTGKKDASEVIIDEVAGQWVALIIIPLDPLWFAAGFVLFRFFDITKLGPVGEVEQLPGGVGVVADDIVAGLAQDHDLEIGRDALDDEDQRHAAREHEHAVHVFRNHGLVDDILHDPCTHGGHAGNDQHGDRRQGIPWSLVAQVLRQQPIKQAAVRHGNKSRCHLVEQTLENRGSGHWDALFHID